MWYFAWALGMGFACSFAILNAMWLELNCDLEERDPRSVRDGMAERFAHWRRSDDA